MFALNRLSLATGEAKWNDQAIELAKAVHPRFFVNRGEKGRERMVWKISTDMRRVLVGSEGGLDPLDGWVIFRMLQATKGEQVLEEEIGDYERIVEKRGCHRVSDDPLDLGMAMWTAHWLAEREEWAWRLLERCWDVASMLLMFRCNETSKQVTLLTFAVG